MPANDSFSGEQVIPSGKGDDNRKPSTARHVPWKALLPQGKRCFRRFQVSVKAGGMEEDSEVYSTVC